MKFSRKTLLASFVFILITAILTTGLVLAGDYKITISKSNSVEASPDNVAAIPSGNAFVGPQTIQSIVKETGPAVVKIETEVKVQRRYDPFFNDPL